ncbi:MAG: phosphoribosylanthranilate isomerase [Saprospiraceae bacterium]|nr:phosphoribosylanthranilate isomerase [Saprospiraceae bacterium]
MTTRVKICCISSENEARMAIAAGASALGLVGAMPSGPGIIGDEQIAAIARTAPPAVSTFLLTSETDASGIINHVQRVQTNTVQIVDRVPVSVYTAIRKALPSTKIVQVVHVINEASVEEALSVAPFVDALLLDSGNPNLPTKELGGTGRVHDWRFSRRIREQTLVPVFLAGGLSPDNARAAIEAVEPFGLDLCSGVRTNGHLDALKLEKFFHAARA